MPDNRYMHVDFVDENTCLRVKEKMKHGVVHGQGGKEFPEKSIFLDQHADDDNIFFRLSPDRVTAERLPDITAVFFDCQQIIRPCTERLIVLTVCNKGLSGGV